MMNSIRRVLLPAAALALFATAGCGGPDSGMAGDNPIHDSERARNLPPQTMTPDPVPSMPPDQQANDPASPNNPAPSTPTPPPVVPTTPPT